jgi:predicted RNase H-like nuclease (RuvC/YqgF family)
VASEQDESDFVDRDFQSAQKSAWGTAAPGAGSRAPTREELESKVHETQQRLEELKRVQSELERERVGLEEARRRRTEFQVGQGEMLEHLTRGIGLLQESEFTARRDAEQMAKTLGDLRDSLVKVQTLNDQGWTQEEYAVELTRALTTIENARMEWNAAQLKWPVLSGPDRGTVTVGVEEKTRDLGLGTMSVKELWKLGLGLTWPLALLGLALLVALILVLINR